MYMYTVFPLESAGDIYQVWRVLKGGAYFKVREMNNTKCQTLFICSFKKRMKHKFSLSVN